MLHVRSRSSDRSDPPRWRTRAAQLLIVAGCSLLRSMATAQSGSLRPGRSRRRACRGRARSSSSSPRSPDRSRRSIGARRDHRPRHRHRLLGGRLDDAQGPLGRLGPRHRVQRGDLGPRLSRILRRAARMNARPDGLEVPLHRSLVEPMLARGLAAHGGARALDGRRRVRVRASPDLGPARRHRAAPRRRPRRPRPIPTSSTSSSSPSRRSARLDP